MVSSFQFQLNQILNMMKDIESAYVGSIPNKLLVSHQGKTYRLVLQEVEEVTQPAHSIDFYKMKEILEEEA